MFGQFYIRFTGYNNANVNTTFGKPISNSENTPNPYRFGGEIGYYQDNSQRNYVRARYYSSNQGRWSSRDPIGFEGGDWNLYRYVKSNPVVRLDPSGLKLHPAMRDAPISADGLYIRKKKKCEKNLFVPRKRLLV